MAYFDGVKIGDKIWNFLSGWSEVIWINDKEFPTKFAVFTGMKFNMKGYLLGNTIEEDIVISKNQIAFWDEVKIKIPEKPKIELKENKYVIDIVYSTHNGFQRNDKETAEKALNQIKRFTRLLALRDQECPNSRGFNPRKNELKFAITYDVDEGMYLSFNMYNFMPDKVYFKTKEDAERICDILNSGR